MNITESRTGPINYYRAAFSKEVRYSTRSKITVPTLVIWGDPDFALDTEMAALCGDHVENLTVKVIQNSSHFVHMDKPKETNAEIRKFLQS